MNVQCETRKRIWEVDCWSLDAAIAASFDWKELVNMLQAKGHAFDPSKPETVLELRAQCLIHEYCHSENEISLRLEKLLNDWHAATLNEFSEWSSSQVAEHILTLPFTDMKAFGPLFWALGSDPRTGFDCIRRRFHQRFQMFALRKDGKSL